MTKEPEEASLNPYAAPTQAIGSAPVPTSLAPHQRIEFKGRLEFEDVWRPADAPLPPSLFTFVVIGAFVIGPGMAGAMAAALAHAPTDSGLGLVVLVGGLIAMVAGVAGVMLGVRFWQKRFGREGFQPQSVTGWYSLEGLEHAMGPIRQQAAWQAFSGYECSPHGEAPIVWLLCPGGAGVLPLPRRFFSSEQDWQNLVHVVGANLPRGNVIPQERAPRPLPAQVAGAPFAGKLKPWHFRRARSLLKPWWMLGWSTLSGNQPVLRGEAELRGSVEEGGIRFFEPFSEIWFGWQAYLGCRRDERRGLVALRLPDNRMHIVPRELFTSEEGWRTFLDCLSRHVPTR